jgi:DNA-binding response OmpR family regulator
MNAAQPKRPILIVEDDQNIASLVEQYLEREGFDTLRAQDGPDGLALARRHRPLLVILDVMLPGLDGWEICRRLRRESDVPIVMLTARADEVDRVAGLSIGADDYVVKPFSPRELVERVKAILRRSAGQAVPAAAVVEQGPVRVDEERHEVTVDGRPVALTPSEFKLLHAMISQPGRVFTRDELLNRIQRHGETVVDRVVDVHVGKLRQKIEPDPSKPQFILTVHGVGYRFADTTAG